MPTRILLKKRRFRFYHCSKMAIAETSLVQKNHQIPRIINQKIPQKLIKKTSMTDIVRQLFISTSSVIQNFKNLHSKNHFSWLPEIMSWNEYSLTKGKMSFIAQNCENFNIITDLEGRTQAIIRNHFLRYNRVVQYQVKIMNQFGRKSHEYRTIKQYQKLLWHNSQKLGDKRVSPKLFACIQPKKRFKADTWVTQKNWKSSIIPINSCLSLLEQGSLKNFSDSLRTIFIGFILYSNCLSNLS